MINEFDEPEAMTILMLMFEKVKDVYAVYEISNKAFQQEVESVLGKVRLTRPKYHKW